MGWALDGKVSAVLGTHTHVQTADAQILPHGTAYMSDVGMCGVEQSSLGWILNPCFNVFSRACRIRSNRRRGPFP